MSMQQEPWDEKKLSRTGKVGEKEGTLGKSMTQSKICSNHI
jgi:hypothetical protein